ncbi:hypothetical protein MUK42_15916 [Musa troglodytarum]|uniref:Uncharacterized protein n=1 Tax=Musa troglodytarum TaxID=320322 RepID=A0A9E7HXH9_9LILI|nr:hypothetical protein MUK42_15916 [Musa troglodytarum]
MLRELVTFARLLATFIARSCVRSTCAMKAKILPGISTEVGECLGILHVLRNPRRTMALVLSILYGIENPKQVLELLLHHHRCLLLLFSAHVACTRTTSFLGNGATLAVAVAVAVAVPPPSPASLQHRPRKPSPPLPQVLPPHDPDIPPAQLLTVH